MGMLVLCNVGARDVTVDGGPVRPARAEGRRLLKDYLDVASRIAFPIIEPCLRYVVAQHPPDPETKRPGGIDRLVLYGTDQPDEGYRPGDTLHFAELGARHLPALLGDDLRRADPAFVRDINPALYDEAFETFGELLADLPAQEVEAAYVIICGGIPACNTALLLQGVRAFGDRLRVVYLPQGGEPQELRAGQQVIGAFREAAAVEHLDRLDFANAVPRLERLGADRGLVELADYAARRLAFDFRSAQTTLRDALKEGERPVRAFINEHVRHDLDRLLDGGDGVERLKALLRELYWNAAITYRHRRYADFLGRVYRFQEAMLRYLVERVLGLPTDLSPEVKEANQRRWEADIRANPRLLAFLEGREVDGEPLEWQKIGRPTYQALMHYATDEALGLDAGGAPLLSPQARKRYEALLTRVNAFERLVQLRHRTIIGHDFEGVSEAQVLAAYKGTRKADGSRRTPVEGMAEIVQMIGLDVRRDPYRAVADFTIQNLRRT